MSGSCGASHQWPVFLAIFHRNLGYNADIIYTFLYCICETLQCPRCKIQDAKKKIANNDDMSRMNVVLGNSSDSKGVSIEK